MDEAAVKTFCDDLIGACREQPFGPETDVWKVDGMIFALLARGSGRVSVKCPDTQMAEMLISVGRAGKAPYLPRGGWIAIDLDQLDESEVRERLLDSYQTVRSALPKRVQAELD
ncbi:MmcQ/YjbR family DNA-binding protein [Actibacterium sp. D379-3]